MQYETYGISAKEWAKYAGMGVAFCGLVAYVFYRSYLVFFLLLPLGLSYPLYKRKDLQKRRLRQLNLEFKEAILLLATSLSAGYSIENAFGASLRELKLMYGEQGMITGEFLYIQGQIRMNRPVEQVLMEFANRSGLDDVRNFAEVFAVAKRSGGELVGIINHTAGVISDRVRVNEEILTMTAAKQFEQKVMNAVPFLLVFYIDLTSPGFFQLMYGTVVGRVLMTGCLAAFLGASFLSQRIMAIDV